MDLTEYRASESEQNRTNDLLELIPAEGRVVLDVGARDGHFSKLLSSRFNSVVALDLEKPEFVLPGVTCVQGDITGLEFDDGYFDFVFCAEVLEHIPSRDLSKACHELARVSSSRMLIGVPYRQDLRVGRTTCVSCGRENPPWGHVNRFDEDTLRRLFPEFSIEKISFVGETRKASNPLSAWLMDVAGNPFGTYGQEEPCVYCGQRLLRPGRRSPLQRLAGKLGLYAKQITEPFNRPHAKWMHAVLSRPG